MYAKPSTYVIGCSCSVIGGPLVELYGFSTLYPGFSEFGIRLYTGIANFFVGLAFLPLRNKLSGGDSSKEGRVFYVFAGLLFLVSSIFFRSYRPRT
jgi:hypothetical protein